MKTFESHSWITNFERDLGFGFEKSPYVVLGLKDVTVDVVGYVIF